MNNVKFTVPEFSLEKDIDMNINFCTILAVELKDDNDKEGTKNLVIKWICRDNNNKSLILIKCYELENELELEEVNRLLISMSISSMILSYDIPYYFINDNFIKDKENYYLVGINKAGNEIISKQIKVPVSVMIQMSLVNSCLSDLFIPLNNNALSLGITNDITSIDIVEAINIDHLAKTSRNNVITISTLSLSNNEEMKLFMTYYTNFKIKKKLENTNNLISGYFKNEDEYICYCDHTFSVIINDIHYFGIECKNKDNKSRAILFTDKVSNSINKYIDDNVR